MSVGGWGSFGAGGFGPSQMFLSLPYRGYRDRDPWVEQFIDAIGDQWDVIYNKYVKASARANLLDPTYTPVEIADANYATATVAPVGAVSRDTMLDVLLYVALGIYPVDSNLTVAQKQALVQTGWNAFRRKGNRIRMLELAAKMTDGVIVGWTVPPYNFSIILPDGAPSPGWGSWVQPTNATAETQRPWILNTIRNTEANITPSFINLGVGYSQFRAGYSSAGETVFPVGARINVLAHEHFDVWAAGAPTGWTKTGSGTLTQSTSATAIDWEFTGNAAVLDLSAAAAGVSVGLSQTATNVNNQVTHRFQLDYAYSNSQGVSVPTLQITDANSDGNTYYWNPTSSAWQTSVYSIALPPSSTRARYACDVTLQAASGTATTFGTKGVTVAISAKSDGTTTTKTTYTLYRVGLYEEFSLALEQAAQGERTAWYPLVDAPGWTTVARTAGATLLELASTTRASYKATTSTGVAFSNHPAISGRSFASNSSWVNLLKGSKDFGADWSLTNATRTVNATISPLVGESVASAPNLTATSTGAFITQATGVTPTSKTYCGGVFVRKLSTDGNFTDVTISLVSTSTKSQAFTVKQATGWQLIPFRFTFGGGDVAAMSLKLAWGAASSSGQIAVASSYLYDVTGKTAVLYPPVTQTPIGSTATLNATTCTAVTASQGVNVLHPLTQRTLASVVRGALALTIVPMFDAASQPNGVIFDLAQAAAVNRLVVRVNSGALELRRWDASGNQWVASLTLTKSPSPAAGSMSWLRDTAITVRCLYDAQSTMLSAGNSNASGTKPGSWAPADGSVATLTLGSDLAGANSFDGQIGAVEVLQLGAATT